MTKAHWENRLDNIAVDCKIKGWDGDGAPPVSDKALNAALALGKSLDVMPINDGGIQISMASEALCFEIGPDGGLIHVCVGVNETAEYIRRVGGNFYSKREENADE
jgi:hypothetical protein